MAKTLDCLQTGNRRTQNEHNTNQKSNKISHWTNLLNLTWKWEDLPDRLLIFQPQMESPMSPMERSTSPTSGTLWVEYHDHPPVLLLASIKEDFPIFLHWLSCSRPVTHYMSKTCFCMKQHSTFLWLLFIYLDMIVFPTSQDCKCKN